MLRHDSEIRSDWMPVSLTRGQAERLAGEMRQFLTPYLDESAHRGRRDSWSCDTVGVTKPGGWRKNANGAAGHTVKVRGCVAFRQEARRLARQIVESGGGEWG